MSWRQLSLPNSSGHSHGSREATTCFHEIFIVNARSFWQNKGVWCWVWLCARSPSPSCSEKGGRVVPFPHHCRQGRFAWSVSPIGLPFDISKCIPFWRKGGLEGQFSSLFHVRNQRLLSVTSVAFCTADTICGSTRPPGSCLTWVERRCTLVLDYVIFVTFSHLRKENVLEMSLNFITFLRHIFDLQFWTEQWKYFKMVIHSRIFSCLYILNRNANYPDIILF